MPSVSSVGTNDKTSQEVVDHHSTTSGMVEPQIQQLDATGKLVLIRILLERHLLIYLLLKVLLILYNVLVKILFLQLLIVEALVH
ncbi:hypothetical protein PVBG_06407 [Plasmodium vivax Brazil I]|uniref:Uncharacterized protein n=1 Tax=Plasmodium vivax (strain Brazil I) TaxID=1033975 RepID=A0A0J9SL25_PLAV1|nr:hypothetical protein PVBG_06407 [Plasmodium vivax Brazil I]